MNNTSEQETNNHAVDPELIVDTVRSRASNFSVSDAIKANKMEEYCVRIG